MALSFVETVRQPPSLVVSSDVEPETAAVSDRLAVLEDQDFSFAGGVSFTVMKARGMRQALALDHHFAKAAFTMLPG